MGKNIERRADMRINTILDPRDGGVDIDREREVRETIDHYRSQGELYMRIADKLEKRLEEKIDA